MLELEGILVDVSDGRLRLAVEKRGLVEVEVPAGMTLTAKAGDEVELLVSLGAEGALTLVALKGEDDADDHGIDFDAEDGEVEIEGLISELSATSLTVSAGPSASDLHGSHGRFAGRLRGRRRGRDAVQARRRLV